MAETAQRTRRAPSTAWLEATRIAIALSFREWEPAGRKAQGAFDLSIWFDDVEVAAIRHGRAAMLNLGHPVLEELRADLWGHDDDLQRRLQGAYTREADRHEWAVEGAGLYEGYLEVGMMKDDLESLLQSREGRTHVEGCLDRFTGVFQRIVGSAASCSQPAIDCAVVPASRTVPRPDDVRYALSSPSGHAERAGSFGVDAADQTFAHLAQALFLEWWRKIETPLTREEADRPGGHIDRSNQPHNLLNGMLSEHLFTDRVYQLCVDVDVLLDGPTVRRLLQSQEYDEAELRKADCLVQLKLMDAEGRRLDFTDVGSGLGYVLPVLASLSGDHAVFVQQPELHLHPALQGAMGDVLVEAKNRGCRCIVETHSEHLLLRILRRVRETGDNIAVKSSALKMEAADLVVHYFDPQPDGTTKAIRLRVDETGEFLDRWPKGFFEERDRDLLGPR